MPKKANGQTPAENPLLFLQGCQFQSLNFELEFYSILTKIKLKFCSCFTWLDKAGNRSTPSLNQYIARYRPPFAYKLTNTQ